MCSEAKPSKLLAVPLEILVMFIDTQKQKFFQMIVYAFLPQHFLYLRPFPQIQGSFRPILGVALVNGLCGGGQQLVLVQLEPSDSNDVSDKLLLLSLMLIKKT